MSPPVQAQLIMWWQTELCQLDNPKETPKTRLFLTRVEQRDSYLTLNNSVNLEGDKTRGRENASVRQNF